MPALREILAAFFQELSVAALCRSIKLHPALGYHPIHLGHFHLSKGFASYLDNQFTFLLCSLGYLKKSSAVKISASCAA
jgi:hypothetical protein